MIARRSVAFLAVLLAGAALACEPGPPDQSNAEAFIADFARTLANGWEGRYTAFYLKSSDIDMSRDGAQMAVDRMTGAVQAEFLRRCGNAHDLLAGWEVKVQKVHLFDTEPRIVDFMRDVSEKYSNVVVELSVGSQRMNMRIDELFRTGGNWRMTLFTLAVDTGTENLGTREIR
jgi:hypothetical protein